MGAGPHTGAAAGRGWTLLAYRVAVHVRCLLRSTALPCIYLASETVRPCWLNTCCRTLAQPTRCPQTAFGRRLLRSWVGKPLRHRPAILARLDAVQELVEQGEGLGWGA